MTTWADLDEAIEGTCEALLEAIAREDDAGRRIQQGTLVALLDEALAHLDARRRSVIDDRVRARFLAAA